MERRLANWAMMRDRWPDCLWYPASDNENVIAAKGIVAVACSCGGTTDVPCIHIGNWREDQAVPSENVRRIWRELFGEEAE